MSTQYEIVEFSGPASLWEVFLTDWRFWLPGAIVSFLLASVLISGWPTGLIPDLSYPYIYSGDGLSSSWKIQRAIEGWIFDNPRSGYPFGSSYLDYPGSDSGSHLILKILGWLTGEYASAIDLYFLFSFFISFIAAFIVLRAIGLNVWYSLASAALFVFLPFHFQRLTHLYYTWYFVVPLFFYVAFYFFYWQPENEVKLRKPLNLFLWFIIFLVLASFGVYYAFFGVIVLMVGGIGGWIRNRDTASAKWALLAVLAVLIGVLINTGPNIANKYMNGTNDTVAVRPAMDGEIYGLKMMQLILPRDNHRFKSFNTFKQEYNNTRPLINENTFAALGVVGSIGFLILGGALFIRLSNGKVDSRLALLALLVLMLFLFGTIGGLGALFSSFISPLIRGWNRISVFIGFGTITALFLSIQIRIERYLFSFRAKVIIFFSAVIIFLLGLYDQTTPACSTCNAHTKFLYNTDRDFIQKIENSLPKGDAIYQLPYMDFPEGSHLNRLPLYDSTVGFLHSKSLRWSYGGMKGREGDFFYRSLSRESIEKQIEAIKRLGFIGIYVDRRGYTDNAKNLVESITKLIGPPTLVRSDDEIVFFRLEPEPNVHLEGLTSTQIMQKAGYVVVDTHGKRYRATLAEGIDFSRSDWPDFVRNAMGLSENEPWGRWSDANLNPIVRIDFYHPLPDKFILILKGQAFGPNVNQELTVNIGSQNYKLKMKEGIFEERLSVDLKGQKAEFIELIPPHPVSPQELSHSADTRKLGVGLINMRIEEN